MGGAIAESTDVVYVLTGAQGSEDGISRAMRDQGDQRHRGRQDRVDKSPSRVRVEGPRSHTSARGVPLFHDL